MRSTDYLIVGGGIAGLTLAESLESNDADFLLVDANLPGKSTAVSAGLINPVTGMRFVLSWNFSELEKAFLDFYRALESRYQVEILVELPLYQRLYLEMDSNAWMARCSDPFYEKYISGIVQKLPVEIEILRNKSFGKINIAYRLHTQNLLTVVRRSIELKSRWIEQRFYTQDLKITSNRLTWQNVEIRKAIIFAEGFRIRENSFFNALPLMPLKGDCTLFYSEQLNWNFVLKDAYSIIPIGQNHYWCGSNFSMNDLSLEVNANEVNAHEKFLNEVIPCPFQITDRFTGIRPAVKDRKPVMGRHPKDHRLIVFNGLGTKGASLAPYCAKILTQMLLADKDVPKELSVERFYKLLCG